jgi:hypothetical protein
MFCEKRARAPGVHRRRERGSGRALEMRDYLFGRGDAYLV